MKFKAIGFDKLQHQLRDLERRTKKLDEIKSIPFEELFNPQFMRRNTSYNTISEFFKASDFEIESQEDFGKIPKGELDKFVRAHSHFGSWEKMLQEAGQKWFEKKMGL